MDTFITPWLIWFLLGIALALLELYLPGFVVLFFGVGCLATAGALLLWDFGLTRQILIFITASIASLLLLRKWLMRVFRGDSTDKTDMGFDDFPHGRHVKVLKTITPKNSGRIRYRGTAWDAVAEETIEAGATVEIERFAPGSHNVFFVRKIE
jgi:membrane protein implicated in regulation of membrane protease activity